MEEKERYELTDTDCILDTERNIVVSDVCDVITNADIITDLLNQQDKRIKELEQELENYKLCRCVDCSSEYEYGLETSIDELEKENQQLKQQIAITEKALELACKEITGSCEYCSYKTRIECPVEADCLDEKINYFKTKAKEMLESE